MSPFITAPVNTIGGAITLTQVPVNVPVPMLQFKLGLNELAGVTADIVTGNTLICSHTIGTNGSLNLTVRTDVDEPTKVYIQLGRFCKFEAVFAVRDGKLVALVRLFTRGYVAFEGVYDGRTDRYTERANKFKTCNKEASEWRIANSYLSA